MYSTKKDVYRYLLPNLLEIQRASFCWFLEKGLIQELENFSVIRDYLGELELSFSTKFYKIKKPKYTLDEAKRRDTTYSVRIYVTANLKYLQQGQTKKGEIFLGPRSFKMMAFSSIVSSPPIPELTETPILFDS